MANATELLAQRRALLVARCGAERADLARQGHVALLGLAGIDFGLQLLGTIRRRPVLLVAVALGVWVAKPRRVAAMLGKGAEWWRTVQVMLPVLPVVQAFFQRKP